MSDDLAAIPADQLLRRAAGRVERGDAEALLLHALGRDRAWLFMHGRDAVP
ncbi:protein-(glutamine-N5) methyltransferase, release factor-specific, partial [Xanthomonas perforans]|nr:protein-(glutamine-N5) methyltransferase, release factor-specific [Xanthomonas perforans]